MDGSESRKLTRRGLLSRGGRVLGAAALGGPALLAGGVGTAQGRVRSAFATQATERITLRYGHVFVANTPQDKIIRGFADRVNQVTNGAVSIHVFPASQLGSEAQMTQQVIQGSLDIVGTNGSLQGFVPEFGLYYLPYLYKNFDHFQRVWTLKQSSVADYIAGVIEQKAKLKTLGYFLTGVRDTCLRSKPIRVLADFKGVKMRVDDAPTSAATFRALGAVPVPVAYAEVYQALQSGVVDAAENPPVNMGQLKWNEVTKYLSLTQHLMVLQSQAINLKKWNSLPLPYQDALQLAMDEAVPKFSTFAKNSRTSAVNDLRKKGMICKQYSTHRHIPEGDKTVDPAIRKEVRARSPVQAGSGNGNIG